jgi:hypothetical protein
MAARAGQLAIEDQRVEGDESLHALAVEKVEDAGQLVHAEVVRAGARVEAAPKPEVDRIGAGGDRGAQALLLAGGGEELGALQSGSHRWVEQRGSGKPSPGRRCASHKIWLSATLPVDWQAPGRTVTY